MNDIYDVKGLSISVILLILIQFIVNCYIAIGTYNRFDKFLNDNDSNLDEINEFNLRTLQCLISLNFYMMSMILLYFGGFLYELRNKF